MGKLKNALQGNLNNDRGAGKVRSDRQLDLFLSLSDRAETKPRIVSSPPSPGAAEPPSAPRPEPEMILPPSRPPPADVSADVRAVLSESGPPRPVETGGDGDEVKPPLKTGIYRRPPRRVAPVAPPPPPPPSSSGNRIRPLQWLREWLSGVEMDRRMVSLVVVLVVLVGVIAFWSACPRRRGPEPGTLVDLREIHRDSSAVREPASPSVGEPARPDPGRPAPAPAAPPAVTIVPADWQIPGTEATITGGGVFIRFKEPVFVSADNISKEGMSALRALAARLVKLNGGGRIIITGHTDDVPLSRPTPQFRNNADLAAARAKNAREHLAHFARANRDLTFEEQAGSVADAPYPNDSPRNRRLNRTATIRVIPAGN